MASSGGRSTLVTISFHFCSTSREREMEVEVHLVGVEVVEESSVDGIREVADLDHSGAVGPLLPVVLEH